MNQSTDGQGTKRGRKRGTRIIVARGENIRTYRLNPWLFGTGVGFLFLFLTAYVGSTVYLIFRDDVLTAAMARQVEIQYDYEDRISLLRSEIDRVTSRHIVETESIEGQVASLLERQDGLRRQQVLLDDLVGRARDQGISFASIVTPTPLPRPNRPSAADEPVFQPVIVMTPTDDTSTTGASMAYSANKKNSAGTATGNALKSDSAGENQQSPVEPVLKDLRSSLDKFEQYQAMAVHALKAASKQEARRLTAAMKHFGVRAPVAPLGLLESEPNSAQGGPFIPANSPNLLNGMVTVQQTLQHIDLLKNSTTSIPVRKPLPQIHLTSSFGYRVDPFKKKPGYHSGIDLRASEGSPVSAAGAGKITHASAKGGYGLMVEISHGSSLKTRYAHLSSIKVIVGQVVNAGDVVGLVGSTGRSTGPHLHYEAVKDGETVDPMAFLDADGEI